MMVDGGLTMVDWLIGSSYSNTLDALRRSADIENDIDINMTISINMQTYT